jgi:hypothetical protein
MVALLTMRVPARQIDEGCRNGYAAMRGPAPSNDERQAALFDDLPLPPPRSSDENARADIVDMIEQLERAKSPPWSLRLLGWQKRRLATLAQKLTPIEAAALTARFEAELERLGSPAE